MADRRRIRRRGLVLALGLALWCRAGLAASPWAGTYTYAGQDGYDGGGTPQTGAAVQLELTLKISSPGDCSLQADGFQTLVRLTCSVTDRPNDHGADIVFSAFDPKAIKESGFFDIGFRKGGVLLSLTPGAKGQGIVTHWQALKPDTAKSATGMFFVRSKT